MLEQAGGLLGWDGEGGGCRGHGGILGWGLRLSTK